MSLVPCVLLWITSLWLYGNLDSSTQAKKSREIAFMEGKRERIHKNKGRITERTNERASTSTGTKIHHFDILHSQL